MINIIWRRNIIIYPAGAGGQFLANLFQNTELERTDSNEYIDWPVGWDCNHANTMPQYNNCRILVINVKESWREVERLGKKKLKQDYTEDHNLKYEPFKQYEDLEFNSTNAVMYASYCSIFRDRKIKDILEFFNIPFEKRMDHEIKAYSLRNERLLNDNIH